MRIKRRRTATTAATVLVLGTVALLFAACGGSSGPGVASLGSSTTTTTTPAAASSNTNNETDYLDAVKYAQCMRTNGVPNMPDPNSKGLFLHTPGKLNGVTIDINSAQYNSANKACTHLLPNGGQLTPAEQQALLAQALKLVQCLRTHGFPNEPDPSTKGGGVSLLLPGKRNSPQVQKALEACKSLAPGGG